MHEEKDVVSASKKKTILVFPFALAVCILIYGIWTLAGRGQEETEDAYIEGNLVQVTSQVSGTIIEINADNTDYISEGTSLVVVNPVDATTAFEKARAELAASVRTVKNQFATLDELSATIELKKADYDKALADYRRRSGLSKSSAISVEDLSHSSDAVNSARASLKVAQSQYAAALTYTAKTTPATHPDVLAAEATFRQAWLDLKRTRVVAPVSGYIAQRSVQVGQHISSGASLMSVVPLDTVWVTANFKETQLGSIRSGQNVLMTSDVYGSRVKYRGQILGIEPGTGSAFSLLPAQNATGNWIKVVQRVPVRIEINKDDITTHPLRPGLSMKVSVDVSGHQTEGLSQRRAPRTGQQKWATSVYADENQNVDRLIKSIVAENE